MGLGQIFWPQQQFEVNWAFEGEALLIKFWFWKFFFEVLSFLNGLSHRCQIGLKLKKPWSALIWDQSGIFNSLSVSVSVNRLEMGALQKEL